MVKPSKKAIAWKKRLPELVQKEYIDVGQSNTLSEMIDSPDKDNFTVVHTLIKGFIKHALMQGLNKGQTRAFEDMVSFLEFPQHDALVLKGYAGTGKTFLVKRLLEYITQTETTSCVAITAPTNKAVNVLYKNSASNAQNLKAYIFEDLFDSTSRLTYCTVYKLLALREVITDAGKQIFSPDPKNPSDINNFKYVIVDETSMIDDELCNDLMKHSHKTRIIFMGDPAQIPPVRHKDSIPFRKETKYNFLTLELTEIMRQKADNPIIAASFEIRDNLTKPVTIPVLKTDLNDKGHGILYIDRNDPDSKDKILQLMKQYFETPEFAKDSDYMKVIAWRRATVNYMNRLIRSMLFGPDIAKYVVGEKLIVNRPVFKKDNRDKYWKILYTTSEELDVKVIRTVPFRLFEGVFNLTGEAYELDVESYDLMKNKYVSHTIQAVHESTKEAYNDLLKKAKAKALLSRNVLDWVTYFNIKKWFADLIYNYTITAHKAQGSTYKNILVCEDDINVAGSIVGVVQMNQIKYTSYSRASERLYILRKNPET